MYHLQNASHIKLIFLPLSEDQAMVPHPMLGTVSDPTWVKSVMAAVEYLFIRVDGSVAGTDGA